MVLHCPHCGAFVPAENINIQQMTALCGECSHVFGFSEGGVIAKPKHRHIPKPKRLETQEDETGLTLSYRRVFNLNTIGALAGMSFGAVVITFALIAIGFSPDAPRLAALLPGAIATLLWYVVAVILTTTTRIRANAETVEVKTGPLPFPISEDKTLATADIARVFCEEVVSSQKSGIGVNYYLVRIELVDGVRLSLLDALPQEYAFYIAQALEAYLQIERKADQSSTAELDTETTTEAVETVQLAQLLNEEAAEDAHP